LHVQKLDDGDREAYFLTESCVKQTKMICISIYMHF